jgi:hypothetical protein
MQQHNAAWAGLYRAYIGNFSIFAINHWLFHHTHSGKVYSKVADVQSDTIDACLHSLRVEARMHRLCPPTL